MTTSNSTPNAFGSKAANRAQLDALSNMNASTDKAVIADAALRQRIGTPSISEETQAGRSRRRVRKYSRFGLSTAELDVYQVFDQHDHASAFEKDFRTASYRIILYSDDLSRRRINDLAGLIQDAMARGVIVCAFIQEPNNWSNRLSDKLDVHVRESISIFEEGLKRLRELGVHCNLVTGDHKKVSIFDDRRLWDGSINFASHCNTDERITRWDSRAQVIKAVADYAMDSCPECTRINASRFKTGDAHRVLSELGKQLAKRRKFLGMSQSQLASLCYSSQPSISYLENGLSKLTADTLIRVVTALGFELRLVPNCLLDSVDYLIAARCKEVDGDRMAMVVERFDSDGG